MSPTISQLNDPEWWDLNAPKDATHWGEDGIWYRNDVVAWQFLNPISKTWVQVFKTPIPVMHKRPDHTDEVNDMVNNPQHYQSDNGIECIDAIRSALGREGFVAYCRGSAIKYAWRSGKKSEHAEDLRKAAWYLERAAEELDTE